MKWDLPRFSQARTPAWYLPRHLSIQSSAVSKVHGGVRSQKAEDVCSHRILRSSIGVHGVFQSVVERQRGLLRKRRDRPKANREDRRGERAGNQKQAMGDVQLPNFPLDPSASTSSICTSCQDPCSRLAWTGVPRTCGERLMQNVKLYTARSRTLQTSYQLFASAFCSGPSAWPKLIE